MSPAHPFAVLRSRPLWVGTGAILGVVAVLFSLFYVGANLNPSGSLRGLPVGLVNADRGATADGRQVNLGEQAVAAITAEAPGHREVSWQVLDLPEARKRLASGRLYGALVVPDGFTASVGALGAPSAAPDTGRPALTVLTNPSAGSMGSSMASRITQQAAHNVSVTVGSQLAQRAQALGGQPGAAERLLWADPVAVRVQDGHPLKSHSGMGLSAFYYALVLVVCGMLGANVVNSQVDVALGYAHSDVGPWRRRLPLLRSSRVQTLAVGSVLIVGLSVVTATLALACAVGVLGMDAPHLALLWLYSAATVATVGLGALALLAVFGTPGMLLVTMVFIAMAVPTAGASTPVEALPGFYRFLAGFEPLRQITGGMRAILYYDAQAGAGLARGWAMTGLGLVGALAFGFGATRFYDRRGLHREHPPAAGETALRAVPSA
ncbi:YhgE/Pip domain-containing protein [Kitasatospora sp. NPDC001547]|uniref:YhgE/Pip domain-containing protein n=1 Tax=Kitasatospora sp. NPDC001547 TaxID=3364015 RepID=UPI0036A51BAB|nr:YhgE/Pip domain-containing protein [Kitasatospora sp. Xyl93]